MVATHAHALAAIHAQTMPRAAIKADHSGAVTPTVSLVARTRTIVAMPLATAFVRARLELACLTSKARVRCLLTQADSIHASAAAIAVVFAKLERAIDAAETWLADAIMPICSQFAVVY